MERVTGIEPVSLPWQGNVIAIIRYPPTPNGFGGQARHVGNSINLKLTCLPAEAYAKAGAEGGNRTLTAFYYKRILSPPRLPIPPLRQTSSRRLSWWR